MSRTISLPPVTLLKDRPEYIRIEWGHVSLNLKGRDLDRLRQLHADLAIGATFEDGRPVAGIVDVFRWLLEAAEQSTMGSNSQGAKGTKGTKDSIAAVPSIG